MYTQNLKNKILYKSEQDTFEKKLIVTMKNEQYELSDDGMDYTGEEDHAFPIQYVLPLPTAQKLGDHTFLEDYGTKYACYGGAMASAISSVEMVSALGKEGFMGSYGSGAMSLLEIEKAIDRIQSQLPDGPYIINMLHSYNDPKREFDFIKLCISKSVPVIEASAFIDLSLPLLYYKISGLIQLPNGEIQSARKIIAKVSREEVAFRFMSPADKKMVAQLLENKLITEEQATMAEKVPVADDVTVEADSGGHTDNRPLVSLLPAIMIQRDELQEKYAYDKRIRIGAAGGISTPQSALAAFQMGAAYVVTGSVNQACVEAGTSDYVKKVLANVSMSDVVMAPCADMFEVGTKVQVIKRGTMYPMNAQKLYDLYSKYKSVSELPDSDKKRIEKNIFKCSFEKAWDEVCVYFKAVDERQLILAGKNEKYKMALIFRWYLGRSSKWAIDGTQERQMDMQIWCGQSLGAFNNWCRGTYLEAPEKRFVADVNRHIMNGAAHLQMQNLAILAGVGAEKIPPYQIV